MMAMHCRPCFIKAYIILTPNHGRKWRNFAAHTGPAAIRTCTPMRHLCFRCYRCSRTSFAHGRAIQRSTSRAWWFTLHLCPQLLPPCTKMLLEPKRLCSTFTFDIAAAEVSPALEGSRCLKEHVSSHRRGQREREQTEDVAFRRYGLLSAIR